MTTLTIIANIDNFTVLREHGPNLTTCSVKDLLHIIQDELQIDFTHPELEDQIDEINDEIDGFKSDVITKLNQYATKLKEMKLKIASKKEPINHDPGTSSS